MAGRLPRFIVIKPLGQSYVGYTTDGDARGVVSCKEDSVFNPLTKIEVEPADEGDEFVHLRFVHTNKYWTRRGLTTSDSIVVATSDKPVENKYKVSCTVFKTAFDDKGHLYLSHVHPRYGEHAPGEGRVRAETTFIEGGDAKYSKLSIDDYLDEVWAISLTPYDLRYAFTYVDWETLVKLPKHVVFKGDNGGYLKAYWFQNHPFLQFGSYDGNDGYSGHEVFLCNDGHVRIKSDYFGQFWRLSPGWIWADSTDETGQDINTLFWPVKLDDRTIALRSAGNNKFCKRLTADYKDNCLDASVTEISQEAKMVVEELVLERNIYNIRYRMEAARKYDEKPYFSGVAQAVNETDENNSSLTLSHEFVRTRSYSFKKGVSISGGVRITVEGGLELPVFSAKGSIEYNVQVTGSFEWDKTTTETETSKFEYTMTNVPARSRAIINCVATQAKYDIPFSYTQRDKKSTDGEIVTSEHIDGIFTGIDCYGIQFEGLRFESIDV